MCSLRLVPTPAERRQQERILLALGRVVADFGYLAPRTQAAAAFTPAIAVVITFQERPLEGTLQGHALVAGSVELVLDQTALQVITSGVLACAVDSAIAREDLDGTALELVNITAGVLLGELYGAQHELTMAPPVLTVIPRSLAGDWLLLRCEQGQVGVRVQTALREPPRRLTERYVQGRFALGRGQAV
jgi:hypothetical protein